jgi:site-specific DNA recombinase
MPTKNHIRVAIYARVSSERQVQEGTIASQLEAVERRIHDDGLGCDPELRFIDDGVSLVQVQGMIAEYERAKIMERSRRGKQHAARRGSVNVLGAVPYGYRYIRKQDGGGAAQYQVVAEEAGVVRKIFEWVGRDHCSIREVTRRLKAEGVPTRTGLPEWDCSTIHAILKNPAYQGTAAYDKTRVGPYKPQRLRPLRGKPEFPKKPMTRVATSPDDNILINVRALVSADLFAAAQEQLEENRKTSRVRARGATYLLQGLIVCKGCGYACHGAPAAARTADGRVAYAYYRCRGSEAWRYSGQKLCRSKAIRSDRLDTAVWDDVAALLSEPERVREEYRRRLEGPKEGGTRESGQLTKLINQVKKSISRLIDAYGDGLLDKSEFEPRIVAARERLSRLEEEHKQRADEENTEAELRPVIGQLEEFAKRVSEGWRARTG